MTKLILILSSLGLTITLLLGMYDPGNPIMWLASTSETFTILRAGLLLIFTLLVTEPPRNVYLRAFIGIVSVVLVSSSLGAFYVNSMQAVDAFLLMAVGIASGITVLERDLLAEDEAAEALALATILQEKPHSKHPMRRLVSA